MSPWLSDLFLRSQTDERLVALVRLGQPRAFTAIVERYRRELLAFAHRLSPDRAEDLVQQTFLSAFSALQRDTEVRHLRGWLYRIVRNLAARESAAWMPSDEIGEHDVVAESAEHAAELRMLAVDALGAVAALPTTQHVALVQTAIQGRSRTEVADVLGLSEGAVRQLVHRARTTLRTAVTAITPLPLVRWFASRSNGGPGFSEATIGAGTASTAGLSLKLGIGAVLATGVVASGVVTVVSGHRHAAPHRARLLASATRGGGARGAARPAVAGGLLAGLSRRHIGPGGGSSQRRVASRPLSANGGPARRAAGSGTASSGESIGGGGSSGGSGPGSGDSSGQTSGSGDHGTSGGGGSDGGGPSGSGGSDGGGTSGGGGSNGGGTSGGGGPDGGGTTQVDVSGGSDGGSGGSDGGTVTSTAGGGSDGGSASISGGDGSGSGGTDGGATTSGSGGN